MPQSYLGSAKPFFNALPKPIATARTDADGKFKIQASSGKLALAATAYRRIVDEVEQYFGVIGVEINRSPATVTLSNDNLTDSSSNESLLRTTSTATMLGEKETADGLASELREILLRHSQVTTLAPAISSTSAQTIPEQSARPLPQSLPTIVTLKQPMPIQVPYGTLTLPTGTRLSVKERLGDKIRASYQGTDYWFSVEYTDQK